MMPSDTRNLRPFLFLFVGMVVWWFAPVALRRTIYNVVYEFEAPSFVLSSRVRELGRYWELRSHSKDDLIRAGRDTARLVATLQYEVSQNKALNAENARLEKLLSLPNRPAFRTVPARVAHRRLGMWWQQIIFRRGEKDGIRPGCPVINAYGVIGRVREVFSDTCIVELVSSPSFRVSSSLSGFENCTVTYSGNGALPFRPISGNIRDIPSGIDFPRDWESIDVVTSGLGGLFPSGLKIGTIAFPPQRSSNGIFQEASVVLSQDLASIEEAAILVPVIPDVLEALDFSQ